MGLQPILQNKSSISTTITTTIVSFPPTFPEVLYMGKIACFSFPPHFKLRGSDQIRPYRRVIHWSDPLQIWTFLAFVIALFSFLQCCFSVCLTFISASLVILAMNPQSYAEFVPLQNPLHWSRTSSSNHWLLCFCSISRMIKTKTKENLVEIK